MAFKLRVLKINIFKRSMITFLVKEVDLHHDEEQGVNTYNKDYIGTDLKIPFNFPT